MFFVTVLQVIRTKTAGGTGDFVTGPAGDEDAELHVGSKKSEPTPQKQEKNTEGRRLQDPASLAILEARMKALEKRFSEIDLAQPPISMPEPAVAEIEDTLEALSRQAVKVESNATATALQLEKLKDKLQLSEQMVGIGFVTRISDCENALLWVVCGERRENMKVIGQAVARCFMYTKVRETIWI